MDFQRINQPTPLPADFALRRQSAAKIAPPRPALSHLLRRLSSVDKPSEAPFQAVPKAPEDPNVANAVAFFRHKRPDARNVSVTPIYQGLSGMKSYRVEVDGTAYHLKLRDARRKSRTQDLAREIAWAYWGEHYGLAPVASFTDVSEGALATRFTESPVHDWWHQAGCEPYFSEVLAAIRHLHTSRVVPTKDNDADAVATEFRAIRDELRGRDNIDHAYMEAVAAFALRLCARLKTMPYNPTVCHGDLHQGNVIYDGHKAWIIDWATAHLGDPLDELAYFAYHVQRPMHCAKAVLNSYRGSDGEPPDARENERYALRLALLHARRYLRVLRGVPWPEDTWRLGELLAEDAAALGDSVSV